MEHSLEQGPQQSKNNNGDNNNRNNESCNKPQELLPICDALFNVISLAAYFCDIVFDVLTAWTFYQEDLIPWSILSIFLICASTLLSQVLSFKWYKVGDKRGQEAPCSSSILIGMHISLCGVLWRYFKLFIPVDLRYVKNEVRDLCLLRLVHGFCEAAPMLLIQLYLIWLKPSGEDASRLNFVSTALSLFNVCWALASFSKNIRRQNVHKLVLTWLGVIFQFLWRLGTVTSRVVALSVYATVYTYWVFLVIILHWFSMLMWLISPKNVFHGEKMSTVKKVAYSTLIAIVYVFCYINIQESNSRQKLLIFYVTMFLENSLLFSVWLIAARSEEFWFRQLATSLVFAGFAVGIVFMCLYYRYFHVRKLSYAYETGTSSTYRGSRASSVVISGGEYISEKLGQDNLGIDASLRAEIRRATEEHNRKNRSKINSSNNKANNGHNHHHVANVPGVFNCRFHPAIKRKKKKPTSFVPPPAVQVEEGDDESLMMNESFMMPNNKTHPMMMMNNLMNGKMSQAFWKRPLSIGMGSENEGSVGSRVDIQQKLQEKKQQQLAELREIEEEIKQGKLKRPHISEIPEPVTERQPMPFEKKQPWFRADPPVQLSPRPPIMIPHRSSDPNELILHPTFLMYANGGGPGGSGYYDMDQQEDDWNYYEPLYQNDLSEANNIQPVVRSMKNKGHSRESIYKSYRIPSDIDSQMSLPRSYTLPREFKCRRKSRKPVKTENFLPSTNSSDGDVDSGEEDSEIYNHLRPYPIPLPSVQPVHVPNNSSNNGSGGKGKRYAASRRHRLHETKL